MKIVFNPTNNEVTGGLKSYARWDSENFASALRSLFNAKATEKIVKVDITEEGISAYFEIKPRNSSNKER